MICSKIYIWENKSYEGVADKNGFPYMDIYIPEAKGKRPAVLILPGGEYSYHNGSEAEPVALKFVQKGYAVFVLYYSIAPNHYPLPLLDAALALSIIRKNSNQWNVLKNKIFVCGFSEGGHLAANLGVRWDEKSIFEPLGMKKADVRPNGLILCYPMIICKSGYHERSIANLLGKNAPDSIMNQISADKHVDKKTPPTFLWHTFNNRVIPVENSIAFSDALNNHDVPFELHIFHQGCQGISSAAETDACTKIQQHSHVACWMDLCLEWLEVMTDLGNNRIERYLSELY